MNKIALQFLLFLGLLTAGCRSSREPELHLYIWSDAIEPGLIRQFEKQQHCRVVIDTYDSNEALYAKLKLGAAGYDLIFPSNYLISLMAQNGLIQPLDVGKLTNLANLDPAYPAYRNPDQITYGIPYLVSYTGLAYRKDKVESKQGDPGFKPSWNIFAEKRFKGRMTMLNDAREALGAALLALGFSANSTHPDELKKATDRLITWKRNLAKFESEQYKNGIASAEYLVVQGYGGDILQVMRENQNVTFAYPEEGTLYSIDYAALLKRAPQPKLAHAFINFLLEPEVAKANILFTCYLHPCQPAYALLPEAWQKNSSLFPPENVREKAELIQRLGPAQALYTAAWDRVKDE